MKTTTWDRENGHVAVVLFENGTSGAVFRKRMKTKKGAENFAARIVEICGESYEKKHLRNLQYTFDRETGEKTTNFDYVNFGDLK